MVAEESIHALCHRIVQEFQPERIILFGSYASGAATPDSDVDLLVLLPFEVKSFRMSLDILNRTNPPFPIDLLARTPEDTEPCYREGDPPIGEALDRGKVLFKRES